MLRTPSLRTLALLPLLVVVALASSSDAHAAKTKTKTKPAALHSLVELELRALEHDSVGTMLVPEKGELDGWAELAGAARPCSAKSNPTHDGQLVIELRCRSELGGDTLFDLRSELALVPGEPTVLGEFELDHGDRLRVTATSL